MNFQFYLEKLSDSENFKKFIKENKDAGLVSCFFSIDKEQDMDNKQHFDYFVPSMNKIFSFKLEDNYNKIEMENIPHEISRISENLNFDFNEIEKQVIKKIKQENINSKIQKMLFSVQNVENKNMIIGTIFIDGLSIIQVKLDLKEMKIIEFEKKSFFDMIKIIKKKK